MKHANISIFVPHFGCPRRCSFCDQRVISGAAATPDEAAVHSTVSDAVSSPGYDPARTEIAFFGGSFTAIDRAYMCRLLHAAQTHLRRGEAAGIRISTRPDCIDEEVLSLLSEYGVTAIELGAQSMDDKVLRLNGRGHDSAAVGRASRLIRAAGFELGLQMMTGLYGDNDRGAVATARRLIALCPDTVRIYPTVVLEGTELAALYRAGRYRPQTVEEAAALGARLLVVFEQAGIPVIRFGLHSIDTARYVAGPWHPALRELALAKLYLCAARARLAECPAGSYILLVPPGEVSKMAGQKRGNLEALAQDGYLCRIREQAGLALYEVQVQQNG